MPEEIQSQEDFRLRAERTGGRVTITVAGELDLTTAPELEQLLADTESYSELEFDLAELDYIDSSGLRLLLFERERARRNGGRLRVTGARGDVARVFAISGLDAELEPKLPDTTAPPAPGSGAIVSESEGFARVYPAEPASVSAIRHLLSDWARRLGISDHVISALGLAVSEAATNAVVHAYADHSEPGPIAVEAGIGGDELWVTVADTGRGMRPRPDSPGLGLGLPLIAQMADGFEIHEGDAGGTEVRIRFSL